MREIKFRVYNKKTRLMYYSHMQDGSLNPLFNWSVVFEDYANDPDLIKLQFTGHRDKNENEIYDGDITEEKNFRTKRIVVWYLHGWFLKDLDSEYYTPLTDGDYEIVVGNVYQNPELLKR